MKNIISKFTIAALTVMLFMTAGCERNLDDLDLATYPTNPEIFIDGFSTGLYYAAYGTSNVTAFSVDTEVKYKGSASMKFSVPDTSDPNGSYAGGVFGTNPARDLSGYNVLTFWAKSSQPAVINEVGFGNDMGVSKYKVTLNKLTLNTNWKQYFIPIPDPSVLTQENGMFFYAAAPQNGNGYAFWIDELKFENLGTLAHATYGIFNGQDVTNNEAEIGDEFYVQDLYSTINLPTGIDQKVLLTPSYFTFTSSNPTVATVNETGVIHVNDSGTAVITAKIKGITAEGSLTIESAGVVVKPTVPAPTPTISSSDVISLYSNAYTNVPVDTWNTHWLNSTTLNQFIQIQGDDVIRYRLLNFVGIEFTSNLINASSMTHFTLDIWTPNPTAGKSFKVKLVDFGADGVYGGGDDSDAEVTISNPTLTSENWISLNIPMTSFAGLTSKVHLAQLVLSGDIPDVYVDNVYFYDNGTTPGVPTTAAPVPTYLPANVISVFSDTYTNIAGTNLNPGWGQATVFSQLPISGNNTIKLAGLNYQGIALGSNQNLTSMAYLHLDFWSANSSLLKVFLISPGPVEKAYTLTVPTSGWTSLDIPLSSFSPVDLTNIFQLKFEGNGDVYLDNILFHN